MHATAATHHQTPEASPPREFRAATRSFPTGVTVVTSTSEHAPCGVTANAFTALSLAPPLVLVCLRASSSSALTIWGNGVFAINILSADQRRLADFFAGPERPRGHSAFANVSHHAEATGSPILDGVACWLDCKLHSIRLAGDHVIAIGAVLALDSDPSVEPLVFHDGRYRAVSDPGDNPPARSEGPQPVATPYPTIWHIGRR